MQTERVTFLTSRDHKAALDAFAKESGVSVGHVVREATSNFIAQPGSHGESEKEAERELELLLPEVEAAVRQMNADVAAMRAMIAATNAAIEAVLQGDRAAA